MSAFPKRKSFGFSLVELMVGIVIVGVLVTLAMPSFQDVLRNAEVRNAAESITNGMQRARAEAVARNTPVQFVLGAGSSWTVSVVSDGVQIDKRDSSEGSRNVTVEALAADSTPATTVTFNSLGQVTDAAPLWQVNLAAVGASQNLRITIGAGGNARMCDPSLTAGSSPRAC